MNLLQTARILPIAVQLTLPPSRASKSPSQIKRSAQINVDIVEQACTAPSLGRLSDLKYREQIAAQGVGL